MTRVTFRISLLTAVLFTVFNCLNSAQAQTREQIERLNATRLPAGITLDQMQQLQRMQESEKDEEVFEYRPELFVGTFNLARMQQELNRRGVTREELRGRLARKGILLDNIREENLERYRDVIMQTMIEIQNEKNDSKDENQLALEALIQELEPDFVLPASVRKVTIDDLRMRLLTKGIVYDNISANQFNLYQEIITETLIELNAELEAEKKEEALNKIFGHEIFTNNTLELYRQTEGASAANNYILGTNDLVRITIFGTSQADLVLQINELGYVKPSNLPQIYLKGLTVTQAKELLYQRLLSKFDFNSDEFTVTIQETRPITVSVIGEAKKTGTYYVSAMNSAFNIVSLAGGVNEIGSIRRIEHIRGSEKSIIDTYKLLTNPSGNYKFNLQQNDVINVPVSGNIVRIEGAVKRPMRYELLTTETLADLLEYAGGLTESAYPDFVQIQRFQNGEIILNEYNLRNVISGEIKVELKAGDVIRIRTSENLLFQRVTVSGFVSYPGQFGYSNGMTVGDALALAGGIRPSSLERAYIERRSLRDTTQVSYIPINLGTNAGLSTELEVNDNIMVFDKTLYSNQGDLTITGAVKVTKKLTFDPSLTLSDLFITAGGVTVGAALNRVEVFRTTVHTDKPVTTQLITLELDDEYNVLKPAEQFVLKPYDVVVVRQTPGFQLSRTVEINGEVEYPGVYPLESRQSYLSDIIAEAGGLRTQADPIGSTVFRTLGNRGYIITNLSDVMNNKRNESFDPILFEGDVITITRRENIVSIRPTGTRISMGANEENFRQSLSLTYQGRKSAGWYIQNYAGGFDKNADKSTVTVTLKNGQVLSTRHFLFFKRYPKVESGSTIQLSMKPEEIAKERFDYDQFLNRTAQTTTSLLTLLLLIKQL
jgi:protein involved in polysaccharide export with SLBB domain